MKRCLLPGISCSLAPFSPAGLAASSSPAQVPSLVSAALGRGSCPWLPSPSQSPGEEQEGGEKRENLSVKFYNYAQCQMHPDCTSATARNRGILRNTCTSKEQIHILNTYFSCQQNTWLVLINHWMLNSPTDKQLMGSKNIKNALLGPFQSSVYFWGGGV